MLQYPLNSQIFGLVIGFTSCSFFIIVLLGSQPLFWFPGIMGLTCFQLNQTSQIDQGGNLPSKESGYNKTLYSCFKRGILGFWWNCACRLSNVVQKQFKSIFFPVYSRARLSSTYILSSLVSLSVVILCFEHIFSIADVVGSAIGFVVFTVLLTSWALTFAIGGEHLFGHAWDQLVMYNLADRYGLTGWI